MDSIWILSKPTQNPPKLDMKCIFILYKNIFIEQFQFLMQYIYIYIYILFFIE
jgi:hypothetical protein